MRVGHGVVEVERRILAAPGVVPPVDDRLLAAGAGGRAATKIGPWSRHQASLVGLWWKKTSATVGARGVEERGARPPPSPVRPVDVHLLVLGEVAHDLRRRSPGTGSNLPGQELRLCGQVSQVPRCGSHSAGKR